MPADPETRKLAGRRWRRRLGWVLLILTPVLFAGWVLATSDRENYLEKLAESALHQGRPEEAERILDRLTARPVFMVSVRRGAAALYLRLGDDEKAHRLLRGQRFHGNDPEDQRLRELSGHCQAAAILLHRADQSQDAEQRVRQVRLAAKELPDSPRVLQRVAEEELLAMTRSKDPSHSAGFEEAYLELRTKAPALAAEFKQRVGAKLAEQTR